MTTLKKLIEEYKDTPVESEIKQAFALAQAGTAADIARLNLLLKKYENTDTLYAIRDASKLGFDTPKAAPPADALRHLEGISASLQALIAEAQR